MKRIFAFWILLSCFCVQANGQINLVPNPSFEFFTSCPTTGAQIQLATPWVDPDAQSSDYFHTCNVGSVGVPQNICGYEVAQDGLGYAGLCSYLSNQFIQNYREFIEVALTDTLRSGKKYCVTFYVSLADSSEYAVSNISAYFSPNGGGTNIPNYLNYNPQINNPSSNVINDITGWTKISGTFLAVGNEKYITIGNFNDDTTTNIMLVNPSAPYAFSYLYVDNVSVYELADCIAGTSSQICPGDSVQLGIAPVAGVTYSWQPTVGLSDSIISNPVARPITTTTYTITQTECEVISTATITITVKTDCDILPPLVIPSILIGNEMFKVSGLPPGSSLSVFDARGRQVFLSADYHNEFGSASVAAGTYIVWFTFPDGSEQKQKLCIVH
ncbi:MAG: hypothetical protein ABIQ40_01180 [Bacteroidia bacterium]